ncbi:TPA: hypothetical protein VAP67_001899 [Streptococcus agalactiae]|nr:hypothetical protein [Streptococcus agalactiae]
MDQNINEENTINNRSVEKETLESIKVQNKIKKDDIEKRKKSRKKCKLASLLIILVLFIYFIFRSFIPFSIPNFIPITLFIFCILILLSLSGSEDKILFEELEVSSALAYVEDQLFTYEIEKKSFEERALQQFNKSQNEIEKYNNHNFNQLKRIFSLGQMLIGFGSFLMFIVIGYSLVFEHVSNFVYIMSICSGVMINFIGAIFINMYSKILKSSSMNHYVMVENNQVYLGNLLASQIKDDELREETLSEVAKSLISKEKLINYND